MNQNLTLILIYSYLIISIFIGVTQFQEIGELSTNYLIFQWFALGISVFLTMKFQNSKTIKGETLAIIGGGFAMMIVIQAVLFFLIGDYISYKMSTIKIIVLVIIAIIIIKVVHKHLMGSRKF